MLDGAMRLHFVADAPITPLDHVFLCCTSLPAQTPSHPLNLHSFWLKTAWVFGQSAEGIHYPWTSRVCSIMIHYLEVLGNTSHDSFNNGYFTLLNSVSICFWKNLIIAIRHTHTYAQLHVLFSLPASNTYPWFSRATASIILSVLKQYSIRCIMQSVAWNAS